MAIEALKRLRGLVRHSRQSSFKTKTEDNQMVRVQDLLPLEQKVDEVITQVNSNDTASYLYKEVTVTSAECIAGGAIELLAAPAANKYYVIDKIEINLDFGTVGFNFGVPTKASELVSVGIDNYYDVIDNAILNATEDYVAVVDFSNGIISEKVLDVTVIVRDYTAYSLGTGLYLNIPAATKPSLGDSVMLFKIWYKLKTFGTEL